MIKSRKLLIVLFFSFLLILTFCYNLGKDQELVETFKRTATALPFILLFAVPLLITHVKK